MLVALPSPSGLQKQQIQETVTLLESMEKMETVKSLLSGITSNITTSLEYKISNKHSAEQQSLNTISQHQEKLKDNLKSALECLTNNHVDLLERSLTSAIDSVETISSTLNRLLSSHHQMRESSDEILRDITLFNCSKWLLRFIHANVAMHQNNYDEAYKIFAKLTDPKNKELKTLQKVLEDISNTDILRAIYEWLPRDILKQCELFKIEAYVNAWIEGTNSQKINNVLSKYLEQSFAVIQKVAKNNEKLPVKLYENLLNGLSNTAEVSVLSHIAGELISLGYDELALECLEKANMTIKNHSVIDELRLDVMYNSSLAYINLEQYEQVLSIVSKLSEEESSFVRYSRYSDICYLQTVAYQNLDKQTEAFESLIKALEYSIPSSESFKFLSEIKIFLLEECVIQDRVDVATILVQKFPDYYFNSRVNDEGDTLLHLAKSSSMVQILLDHKVDILKTNGYSIAPVNNVISKCDEGTNIILVQKPITDQDNLNISDKNEFATLHNAVANGNEDILKRLLESGANVNCKDDANITPLQLAVLYNNIEIVRTLLNYNADPKISGRAGFTPLHVAAENGNIKMLELLEQKTIKKNGTIKLLSDNGNTLMHNAAIGIKNGNDCCWDVIKWLLEKEFNPFEENHKHQTPRDILDNYDWSYAEKYDDILELLGYYTSDDDTV